LRACRASIALFALRACRALRTDVASFAFFARITLDAFGEKDHVIKSVILRIPVLAYLNDDAQTFLKDLLGNINEPDNQLGIYAFFNLDIVWERFLRGRRKSEAAKDA